MYQERILEQNKHRMATETKLIPSTETKTSVMTKEKDAAQTTLNKLDDDDDYDYITVPPDGGYGWVVLVACFLINMIVDGFLYAFGAISEHLQKHFKSQEWAVSLIISLACGFYLLSAPVASALCNKWGCRTIGIIGSVLAAASVAASVLSPNIYFMWLLFGLMGGIGMGLVYLPSIVMVGYYFENKRAIATGIVTAGTGIGSMAFGPLSHTLFKRFQWKLGLLMLAAILSLCAVCCVFMRPLKPIRKRRLPAASHPSEDAVFNGCTTSPLLDENKGVVTSVVPSTSTHGSNASLNDVVKSNVARKRSRANSVNSTKSRQSIKEDDAARPLYKEDVLYQGDTRDLPEYKSQPDIPTYVQQTTVVPETTEPSEMKSFWDIFLKMTNVNVLNDKKMLIICLANVCSMIGFYSPYLFIVKMAVQERNIDKDDAVWLLALIGFSNTAARFLSGWITKIPYMSPLLVNNIGLTVAGIATLLVPLCTTWNLLVVYCIVWGGFIAFHVSLSPVIVCQLVGLDLYSSALGLTLMFRGITSLTAPPIMGAIRDYTSSFTVPFIIGGISFLVSALMHFSIMWIDHKEAAQSKKLQGENDTKAAAIALDV